VKLHAVIVRTRDPHRAGEALRAALGLTLRGDDVAVILAVTIDESQPLAARCLGALRALGHDVDAPARTLRRADGVEVWT
jgi:hypothetical protein